MHGTVLLIDPDEALAWAEGSTCEGSGGYSDLAGGAEVVISDDAGKTLVITQLDVGKPTSTAGRCQFTFTTKVPAGRKFYGVTVSHRGTVKLPEKEISAPALSIGD